MIDTVLKIIKDDVKAFLNLKMQTISNEEKICLAPITDQNNNPALTENTVCMNLVKIEEEKINTSYARKTEITKNNMVNLYNPPVHLYLYIIFVSNFSDYTEALKFISYIISFFQTKNVFTSTNTPALDPEMGKITMELYNQAFEEQSHMWGTFGTSYKPSVLYKLRMLTIQEAQIAGDSGVGTTIDHSLRGKS